MKDINCINREIQKLHISWLAELRSISPQLLTGDFSNIFCTGVPNNWFLEQKRIFIVGEEATWKSREIYNYENDEQECNLCQQWILEYLSCQLFGGGNFKKNNSPFWKRIRNIHEAFPNAAISWTNIDIINTQNGKKLSESNRKALHKTNTRILNEVIQLTNPTNVLFCGWHITSLKHEYPELLAELYSSSIHDSTNFKAHGYIFSINNASITYTFTYHPCWPYANSSEYLKRIIDELVNS